jgi:hypothetical protein
MLVRVGDPIKRGQRLARLFGPEGKLSRVKPIVAGAIDIQDSPREPLRMIVERIE